MRSADLMISMDCGVLDSTFPELLKMVRVDLQSVLAKLQEMNDGDPGCVQVFLVIRYLDESNTYVARRLKFQKESMAIYADVVVRSNVLGVRASLSEFVSIVFEVLRSVFHEVGLLSNKKGVRFNEGRYLKALQILEKFYAENDFNH